MVVDGLQVPASGSRHTLIALLSLGVATAARDSAVAIGPLPAGLDAQATTGINSLPLTPWQGLGVVALWTAAVLLGALALKFRDA